MKVYINRVNVFFSGCESLIRKMLVLDPHKRYTIDQIKRHSWMMQEAPRLLPSTGGSDGKNEPNEQIIHLMQNLGIDSGPIREVSQTCFYAHTGSG